MSVLLRALGAFLVAAAFASLIVDATRSIAGGRVLLFPLADTVRWLFPTRFPALDAALGAGSLRTAWTVFIGLPTWSVCGILGILLLVLGTPRVRDDRQVWRP